VLQGEVLDGVAELKAQDGGPILVGGSQTLVHALLDHDLVDELRLMVFPVTIGSGRRVFPETTKKSRWKLTDTRAFPSGVRRRNGRVTQHVVAVMPSGHEVRIRQSDVHVEVGVDGVTIAESDRPVLLDETGLPTRYYLPREDVRMDMLRPTTFHTTCPFKGEASYWSLDLDGEVLDGVVWSYETPIPQAEAIAGLLCFYTERVELKVGTTA